MDTNGGALVGEEEEEEGKLMSIEELKQFKSDFVVI